MINWEVVRSVFYVALFIGAPSVFFIFVNRERDADISKALAAFNDEVERMTASQKQIYEKNLNKKDQELSQKDALLSQKDAELAKIRPLLKYVRNEPVSGSDPSKADPDFGDDTV